MKLLMAAVFLLGTSMAADAALKVGDKAPDFTAAATLGGHEFTFHLADALKTGPVVVYFYPAAFTQGCTIEAHEFAAAMPDYRAAGASVIGVSHDDVAAQKAFKDKYHLPFTLIADMDSAVINAFGVPAAMPLTSMAHRSAYLIKDGKIIYADYKGTTEKQAEMILAELAKPGA